MQAVARRTAARAAQTARSCTKQQQRRWAHDAHDSHHAHTGPTEARLGRGFYITVALVPFGFALAKFSGPGKYEQPYWTRVIQSYDGWRKDWADRNDLHTKAIEQAARDKNIFINSGQTQHVELKFPEVFNTGSQMNVPAGHMPNIDKVIAKYEKQNFEENERKLQQLRNNQVPREQAVNYPSHAAIQ